ncbi:efflux RND transporter periplasmic adaptor subunit [Stigmatella aurantiaca]|uniref:HlyD-like secretion protein n=1 Tax=Stigmatella aurantiaca (strain DW4/3-1) TaxID=378806 RepID=Q08Z36_STIAD|nr:efflux RND transporter periplasmic adaptor subunit [Stigmatella aurantiaca]ADO74505.1 HlyD-like secretion protein [Stigmatella aurantiaca DW4/3-1]EAU65742.1 multidrug efflux transporter [Stigmatella aurantiaca DW4/3-1]
MRRVRHHNGQRSFWYLASMGSAVALLTLVGCGKKDAAAQGGPDGGSAQAKPVPVEVVKLQPGPMRDTQDYLGTLISRTSVTVYPQATGYVQSIDVKPGQRVEAGQILIQVDPREGRALLESVQAQRASAQANLDLAQRSLQRSEQLVREGLMSRQEYDQSVAQAKAAEASARAASAQLTAQAVQLGFTHVKAPFDGIVGDIPVKVGDFISPQTVVTSVDQSQALEVSVALPAQRVTSVRVGETRVEVLGDKETPVASATVFFVAPNPDPQTQLVEIKAAFKNEAGLLAGQRVPVRVVFDVHDALRMPAYAVARQSGQSFAWVVASGDGGTVAQRRPVTLGDISDNAYEVREGLKSGEQVVVTGLQILQNGQAIEPKPHEREGVGGGGDAGVGSGTDAGQ